MEDPWRCLDALFEDRSTEGGRHETWRQHMNIRKRRITRLLPRSKLQSLHSFQSHLSSAFPKETTFRLMHDFIEFQKTTISKSRPPSRQHLTTQSCDPRGRSREGLRVIPDDPRLRKTLGQVMDGARSDVPLSPQRHTRGIDDAGGSQKRRPYSSGASLGGTTG